MTKQELIREYNVTLNKNGYIQDLGKFEKEHWSTLYFYDALLNGDFGECSAEDPNETLYSVSSDEQKAFDKFHPFFILREMENGFVLGQFIDADQAKEFKQIIMNEQNIEE